ESSTDPVFHQAAGKRDYAVALRGLRDHSAREQPLADRGRVGQIVKPKEVLPAPARLHSRLDRCDVLLVRLDGLGLQIDGKTAPGRYREAQKEQRTANPLQFAPTGFFAAASTTSR